ncbi:hypothetical protein [Acaricomes phytoseiuli]|uniref:hypothetical protein n=1 Tax=Acaricomes phytoseiuli TaxID=291968 RepID=UPI0012EACBFD|nr:hypothetical protein [Acaricomes phytoseiuli]
MVYAARVSVAALVSAALLVTGLSSPASATSMDSGNVPELIQRIAPDQGQVLKGETTPRGTQFRSGPASIQAPSDPVSPVKVAAGGSVLSFSLPQELDLSTGSVGSDGTVVYEDKDAQTDTAVQALDGGSVRVQTILRSPSSPRQFSYRLSEGFSPVMAEDGAVWAVGFDNNDQFAAYSIKEAWAKDATGKPVPTRYEIRGNDLVQVVSPTPDSVYPIVADPTWEWYNFAYGVGFNKAETRALANAATTGGFCGVLGRVASGIAAAACGVAAAYFFFRAQQMAQQNKCLFISVAPVPLGVEYISANCR